MVKPSTPAIGAIKIDASDNVATCLDDIERGASVSVKSGEEMMTVTAANSIPRGHKIALQEISEGDAIRKYGEVIGKASAAIGTGSHVHSHNVVD